MQMRTAFLAALWLTTTITAVSATSSAQTPPGTPRSSPGANQNAVRHYEDGVAAANQSQWAKAHESFLAAWKLKQHFQIAANLGRAEIKLGKYCDAVEHLTFFLREASEVTAEERKVAEEMLEEARAKVGSVTIIVDRAGADVLVDGVSVGKSPIRREVCVNPGKRTVETRLEGVGDDRRALTVAAGSSPKVLLTLSSGSGGQVDPGARAPDASSRSPQAARALEAAAAESGGLSMPLIGTGIAVSAVAAGAGVVLTVVSQAKANDIGDKCKGPDSHRCTEDVTAIESARYQTANAAVWCFIGAGAVTGATAGYVIFGPNSKSQPTSAVAVKVHPQIGGVIVSGTW